MTQPSALPSPKTGLELLDLYFLELRSHLLEAAAVFDRLERAPEGEEALRDPRVQSLLAALNEMNSGGGNRTERILRLLSVD